MNHTGSSSNVHTLDSYSILIVSKYFQTANDYLNIICVCKKFKETTEKLRYNPISITSLKLFPKLETHCLYSKNEDQIQDERIVKYELWYPVNFKECLIINDTNVIYHHICYTRKNGIEYYESTVPEGITEIGKEFYSLKQIREISIPTSVNKLGSSCCFQCSLLTSITIPPSIQKIPSNCFQSCYNLRKIELPNSITSLGISSFYECKSLTSVTIPLAVQSIPSKCFENCYSLQSVKLPNDLTSFDDYCFYKCYSLTHIIIPTLIQSIPCGCFQHCSRLKSVELPNSLTSLVECCFESCKSLTNINIPPLIQSIPDSCFRGCIELEQIEPIEINFSFDNSYVEHEPCQIIRLIQSQ
ncbi:Leucine rich repeat containing protein BspA family protein [Entamoeba marina]